MVNGTLVMQQLLLRLISFHDDMFVCVWVVGVGSIYIFSLILSTVNDHIQFSEQGLQGKAQEPLFQFKEELYATKGRFKWVDTCR